MLAAWEEDMAHSIIRVMNMDRRRIGTYAIAIAIALAVGVLSAVLTMAGMENFDDVEQSRLTPPDAVFPIVWTALYTLMGIGSARVFLAPESEARSQSLTAYGAQLIFNFFWSLFFFNMRAFGLSLVWILALWALIGLMILLFWKVDKPSALLQIPYFLWVSVASYLTFQVWRLNP